MDIKVPSGRQFVVSNAARYGTASSDGRVVLDFSEANFVDPFGLVTIAALVESAIADGVELDLKLPVNGDVRRWLSRMHLGRALAELGAPASLPEVHHNPLGDRLLELVRFEQHSGADDLAEKVYSIFEEDDQEEAKDLYRALADAAANVCDHSGQSGGWAALQQYGVGSKRKVALAVADSGKGLRASLAPHHAAPDDRVAIELAMTRGVSGTGKFNRGLGLNDIAQAARRRAGKLHLWSGRATASTGATEGSLYPRLYTHTCPGTIVYATLNYTQGGDQL